jgi:anti-sigma factor RsiW
MNCEQTRELLSPLIDGELDARSRTEVEAHLAECTECRTMAARIETIGRDIAAAGRVPAPAGLAARVRASLQAEAGESLRPANDNRWWMGAAAALLMVAATSGLAGFLFARHLGESDIVRHDVVAAHMRALVAVSPIEVASADTHTVKPWFAGKVDFSPEVKDLAAEGFPLVGGRLDYIDGRRVAVLVYKRNKHVIDVYVSPAAGADTTGAGTDKGYNLLTWRRDGLDYRAISDLNLAELGQLRDLF